MVASSSFLGSWQGWGLKSLMGLEPLGGRNTALPYSGAKAQCSLVVMGLGFTAGHTWDMIPGSAVCVWADFLNFLSLSFFICRREVALIVPPQCPGHGWHSIHDFFI